VSVVLLGFSKIE
jgi:aryl-alcohol dehydrogenase-like predicted oxidoreductase